MRLQKREELAISTLGRIPGFQPFRIEDVLALQQYDGKQNDPCYLVIIYPWSRQWSTWRPGSVDEVPPARGDAGLYRRCRTFGESLSETRGLNAVWLSEASVGDSAHWAVTACIEPAAGEGPAKLRFVGSLDYRSKEIQLASRWTPTHLLDVPNCQWKEGFRGGSDLPYHETFEAAVHEVLRQNRSKYRIGNRSVTSWYILVAIENHALGERLEYRCWRPDQGVLSLESSRRFHVFDRTSWPIPEDVTLDLDA